MLAETSLLSAQYVKNANWTVLWSQHHDTYKHTCGPRKREIHVNLL